MKLSEAILLGSIGSEQGFGGLSAYKEGKYKCVIGAALLAINDESLLIENTTNNPYARLGRHWPWVWDKVGLPTNLPLIALSDSKVVVNILWVLNDRCRWTRPAIAAWVATVEPQDEIVVQPTIQEVYSEVK